LVYSDNEIEEEIAAERLSKIKHVIFRRIRMNVQVTGSVIGAISGISADLRPI